jgi:putative oxidoreductase
LGEVGTNGMLFLDDEGAPMTSKRLNIVGWVLQIVGALIFAAAAVAKFAGVPEMVDVFAKVGVGQWFRYVTGSVELLGALALLWPRTTPYAAIVLGITMVCAGLTDVFILRHAPALAITLFVGLSVILWIRRARLGGRAVSAEA